MNCFEILGLPRDAEMAEVKNRWRSLLTTGLHPDQGGDADNFHRHRKAYEAALVEAKRPRVCLQCEGKGHLSVTHGFATVHMPCKTCNGSGKKETN